MDTSAMTGQVTNWIQTQFSGQQTISKDELVNKSQNSDLPQEAKQGFQQLPQGQFSKDELIGKVQDMMGQKAGAGMGGMGGMGGGMGGMGGGGGMGR